MKRKAAFFIALRYLWARAHEGGRYLRGAATGIAISLIPIIVTLIVSDGMIRGILDRYLEMGTGHIQVFAFNEFDDLNSLAEKINSFDGVLGAWAEMRSIGILIGAGGRSGVTVRAVQPSFWDDPGGKQYLNVIEGVHKPETDRDMVLGETLASNIGVKPGDTVRLMTIRPGDEGRVSPRSASFVVRGIVSCGYNDLDALWCIVSRDGGNRILSPEQSSSSVLLKIEDPYRKIEDFVMSLFRDLGPGYDIQSWKELLLSQYNSYESTRQLLLFIMALIVLVAATNVSSATGMLVLERQRDIAVLKISGSSTGGVKKVFIWSSFLTGLSGAIIGITLGLLIGANINSLIRGLEIVLSFFSGLFRGGEVKILDPGFYLETIPIIINWNNVLLIGLLTVVFSVLASLIPAHRAGKLKPMELLRKT